MWSSRDIALVASHVVAHRRIFSRDGPPPHHPLHITGPVNVVLFEGWMLGFKPLDPHSEILASRTGLKVPGVT